MRRPVVAGATASNAGGGSSGGRIGGGLTLPPEQPKASSGSAARRLSRRRFTSVGCVAGVGVPFRRGMPVIHAGCLAVVVPSHLHLVPRVAIAAKAAADTAPALPVAEPVVVEVHGPHGR